VDAGDFRRQQGHNPRDAQELLKILLDRG